jgi:peptide/nickel transport system substrate-binding protein
MATPSAKPAGKVTIVVADAGAQHLDPHQLVGGAEGAILNFMFEGLLGYDLDGKLQGRLATSWEAKENATVWDFKLRQGVKFQNGDPLTAEDVKFSFEKAVKDIGNVSVQLKTSRFGSAEVVDQQTVRIRLTAPSSIFEDTGGPTGIEPKAYIDKVGAAEFTKAPVGTGPYKFVSRRLDEYVSFEAYNGHWRGTPFIKSATLRFAAESSVRLAMLKAGEADIMGGVTPTQAQEINSSAGLRTISAPGTSMMWLWPFGATKIDSSGKHIPTDSPWANKLVRQAANYAVDRGAIVKGLFRGDAAPMVTVVMPGAFGFNPTLKPYPFDPKKAKDLLAQAGYANGFTTDLYSTPHAAINFTEETTVAVAKMWEDVGIKSNIKKMDYGTYLAMVRDRKIDGIGVIATVFQPNAWSTLNNYTSARSWPSMMWDASIDADLDKVAAESDRAKREALLQDLIARDYEMASNVFLVYGNTTYGVNSHIKEWPQQRGYGYVNRVDLMQLAP